ncbi:unnamed protein product [Diatraea saccharalis]|uniref:FAD-binding PCMH-type domain-containing protein n=1 Tax=Diatraea saccharalis TaxID=40085 RepID=A0A9N9R2S8_9NEOP|nr:unnamed protein product [Diatraea saccharalis]
MCLVSVVSCQDWEVTTVEGIGNRRSGYHPVQKALAQYNGTQCGYCSPGWVMSMYSLLESKHYDLTQYEIENSFGSNTCRCTGYRPILDAFKSFAKDAPKPKLQDIEDLKECKSVNCKNNCDNNWCFINKSDTDTKTKKIVLKDNRIFYRVNQLDDIFYVLDKEGYESYMLMGGNTGRGATPILEYPRILIDISAVQEIKMHYLDQNLVVGAGTTLTDLMDIFLAISKTNEEFAYLQKFYEHLDLVAHIPVRNIGTIAGNLMTKHRYPKFSSDLYLLFESVGAYLTIVHQKKFIEVTPQDFLHLDMTGRVITFVKFPPLPEKYKFTSFKIMTRSQNAHAQVNAAFLYEFDHNHDNTVLSARIVFGGLSETFTHAQQTERFLVKKKIFTNEVLQEALRVLHDELIGLLQLIPESKLKPFYRSGAKNFKRTRPVSKGVEVYDTNPVIWPINEPMPRIDAMIQCAGEAEYVNDIPVRHQELYCAFVTSDICVGEIESIDPTPALKLPGVVAFFAAKDIPGKNSYLSQRVPTQLIPEEVFAEKEVGVSSNGEIQYLEYHFFQNYGYLAAEAIYTLTIPSLKNCYDNRRWQYKLFSVTTDLPSNTFARAPGELEAIALTEHIMERISYEIEKDPVEVRLNNIDPLATDTIDVIQTVLKESEYYKRKEEIAKFNSTNRWKKKGLRVAFLSWPAPTLVDYHVLLSVFHGDGTVVVAHGGVDIGQGINTRVIQVVAYTLNISMDKIKIKPTTVEKNPNTFTVGGSRTTHSACFGAIKCCQMILDRLSTVRETLNNPTWEVLVEAAFNQGINLQASYRVTANDVDTHRSAGAVVTEVELDILTGEHEILRVDLVEDVGTSVNPELDIGQVEGAFIMGIGYWTHEHLDYDKKTGELLTDRTWNYDVPLAKDIPIDFRVRLRRNSFNPFGTLGSKGESVSEPPICLAVSVVFALREAIAASREDSGYPKTQWFDVDAPYTIAKNVLKADVQLKEFLFN